MLPRGLEAFGPTSGQIPLVLSPPTITRAFRRGYRYGVTELSKSAPETTYRVYRLHLRLPARPLGHVCFSSKYLGPMAYTARNR